MLLLLLTLLTACANPRPLPSDAAIWQRAWTPAVRQAVLAHGSDFSRLVVLAAELSWPGGAPQIARIHPDSAALARHPVVAVLRINPWKGDFAQDQGLPTLASETVARLQADQIDVVELELDFDAASSQLGGYATWVRAVRAACPVPVSITALPDWLSRPELPGLLAETDGWTLQVHDFEPPASPEEIQPLLRADEALAAVGRAAALHRPFYVALPTYTYTAAFDPDGRYLGATAERAVSWRAEVQTREVGADPAEVARIVATLSANPPPELEGLVWFRLSTEQDAHAWRWSTLAAVMAGRAPQASVHASFQATDQGLVDLRVTNTGDADAPLPDVTVEAGLSPLAADGYGGWEAESGAGVTHFKARPGARLAAGEERALGWIRYPRAVEVSVHVLE